MKQTLPLVSIIVPVYNVEQYLAQCIDSLLTQTYTHLEIILVDDGSTDKSGQICATYAQKDNRIVLIKKANGGLSDARNAGIDKSTGTYLAFVDSDDVVHPQFIDLLHKSLGRESTGLAEIACCNLSNFHDGEPLDNESVEMPVVQQFSNKDFLYKLFEKSWIPKAVIVCNKLFHRSVFASLRFPFARTHEDEYVFFDIFSRKITVSYIDEKLYFYRQRQGSIMAMKFAQKNIDSFLDIHKRRKEYALLVKDQKLYQLIRDVELDYKIGASFYSGSVYKVTRNFAFLKQVFFNGSIRPKVKLAFLRIFLIPPHKH